MIFSSITFLFVFLPIVILGNFLLKEKLRNYFLLLSSLIFFAWGGVSYSIILLISLLVNYLSGLIIAKEKTKKLGLVLGITLNLLLLGTFKYVNFITENINELLGLIEIEALPDPGIILPIGISFYTFQAMSYIIDVYRGEVKVQRNFFNLALYISFFPQLIAGPIVRYKHIEKQILKRKNSKFDLSHGIQRFVLGLFKKVIIADQFAQVADEVFALPESSMGFYTAWIGILAYTFQIYFDFSGYSCMAIGLGRMFGFKFPENFNFPYIARNIREFWQRWHMTLSSWFRNYLYFPLGGSKGGQTKTIINLLIVFLATSIWHGANWTFIVWGMTHGFFMMLERLGWGKILTKLWHPFQHIYTLLVVVFTWVFFRANNVSQGWDFISNMVSPSNTVIPENVLALISSNIFIGICVIALISCTPFWIKIKGLSDQIRRSLKPKSQSVYMFIYQLGESIAVLLGIYLPAITLVSDSYSPFIYFQF